MLSMMEQVLDPLPGTQSAAEFLTTGLFIKSQFKTSSSSMSPSLSTTEDTPPDTSSTAAPSAAASSFIEASSLNLPSLSQAPSASNLYLSTLIASPTFPTSTLPTQPTLPYQHRPRPSLHCTRDSTTSNDLPTAFRGARSFFSAEVISTAAQSNPASTQASSSSYTALDEGAGAAFGPAEVAELEEAKKETAPVVAIVQELGSPQEAIVAWLSPWSWYYSSATMMTTFNIARRRWGKHAGGEGGVSSFSAPLKKQNRHHCLRYPSQFRRRYRRKPIAPTIDANCSGWVVLTDARSIMKVLAAVVSNTKPAITAPALKQVNTAASNSSALSVTRPTPSSGASSLKESNQVREYDGTRAAGVQEGP
ncbi:hypothetical protein BDZ97DRAFT_2076553 [Flammula alnicola]|nr:hypothetical protein BDZ97DRAFT_2076553 [Flammula alnicola]